MNTEEWLLDGKQPLSVVQSKDRGKLDAFIKCVVMRLRSLKIVTSCG